MKRAHLMTVAVAAVLAAAVSVTAWAEAPGYGAQGAKEQSAPSLEQMLVYAIQDEYLARAEYDLIMERYGRVRPFANIRQAEERHIEWLEELFRERGLAVPEDEAAAHTTVPPEMKSALEAGVQAELDNIGMYGAFLAESLPADVRELFERLKGASRNHLEAFRRQLERYN